MYRAAALHGSGLEKGNPAQEGEPGMQIGWLAAAPSPDLLPTRSAIRAGKTKAQATFLFLPRAAGCV